MLVATMDLGLCSSLARRNMKPQCFLWWGRRAGERSGDLAAGSCVGETVSGIQATWSQCWRLRSFLRCSLDSPTAGVRAVVRAVNSHRAGGAAAGVGVTPALPVTRCPGRGAGRGGEGGTPRVSVGWQVVGSPPPTHTCSSFSRRPSRARAAGLTAGATRPAPL